MKKPWVLSYPLSAQRRLWSDWADAQADMSLPWAHTYFVGFVMSWLKYCLSKVNLNFQLLLKNLKTHRIHVQAYRYGLKQANLISEIKWMGRDIWFIRALLFCLMYICFLVSPVFIFFCILFLNLGLTWLHHKLHLRLVGNLYQIRTWIWNVIKWARNLN